MTEMSSQILSYSKRLFLGGANTTSASQTSTKKTDKTSKKLVSTLQDLMERIQTEKDTDRHYAEDLFMHVYSPIIPRGFSKSGSECCEILFSGTADDHYTIPKDEFRFLGRNSERLCTFVLDRIREYLPEKKIANISLGCGPHNSILTKDLPLARDCTVSHYTALDINNQYAKAAAELVSIRAPKIATNYITTDFTKKLPLEKSFLETHIPLLTLFGGTLGQFPLTKTDAEVTTAKTLLSNLAKSTNYNGVFFGTLDTENDEHLAESKYKGGHYSLIMNTFWGTVREVLDDNNFDPSAFKFSAEFDKESKSVLFVHTAKKEAELCIKGKSYKIPKGTDIVIGRSQKTGPADIYPIYKESGWVPVQISFQYDSMIRAVALVGRDLAKKIGIKPASPSNI